MKLLSINQTLLKITTTIHFFQTTIASNNNTLNIHCTLTEIKSANQFNQKWLQISNGTTNTFQTM